jgi:hypothetical protein
MISLLADAIRDPTVFKVYLWLAMGVMVGPMILLTVWYHARIGRTEGGRRLMQDQRYFDAGGKTPRGAVRMARGLSRGNYGDDARRLQNRTYVYVLGWVLANVIVFGALFWAIETNHRRDAAAKSLPTSLKAP